MKKKAVDDKRAIITGSLHSLKLPPEEAPVTNERLPTNNNAAPTKSIFSNFSLMFSVGLAPLARL